MTQLERAAEEFRNTEYINTIASQARSMSVDEIFIAGWRACRAAMLAVAEARLSYKGLDIGMIESFGEKEAHEQK